MIFFSSHSCCSILKIAKYSFRFAAALIYEISFVFMCVCCFICVALLSFVLVTVTNLDSRLLHGLFLFSGEGEER